MTSKFLRVSGELESAPRRFPAMVTTAFSSPQHHDNSAVVEDVATVTVVMAWVAVVGQGHMPNQSRVWHYGAYGPGACATSKNRAGPQANEDPDVKR